MTQNNEIVKETEKGIFKYMTLEEFEVFSPLYYVMSYEEYSKRMVHK